MTVVLDKQAPLSSIQVATARRAIRMWARVEDRNIDLRSAADFEGFLADHPKLFKSVEEAYKLYSSFRRRQLQAPISVLIAAHFHLFHSTPVQAGAIYARFDEYVGFRAASATSDFGLYVKITRFAALDPESRDSQSPNTTLPSGGMWGAVLHVLPLADGIVAVETRRRCGLLVSLRRIVAMPRGLCPAGVVDGQWVWLTDRSADLVRLVHASELGITGSQFDELELTVARRLPVAWARWKSGTLTRAEAVPCNITFYAQQRLTAVIAWLPRGSGRAEGIDWLVRCGLDREDLRDQVWVNPVAQAYCTERAKWTEYAIERISEHSARLQSEQDRAKDTLISRLVLEGWTRHALHLGVAQEQIDIATRSVRRRSEDRLSVTRPDGKFEPEENNDD